MHLARMLAALVGLVALSACSDQSADPEPMLDLRIIETTDIHAHVMAFDYYRDRPTERLGLARTASLIRQAQREVDNSVLVDNGDLIQGSPMGDYVAHAGLSEGEVHPVYQAMNQLGYDVGNIGNHEFNFGLEFLQAAINGAAFPYISANVLDAETLEPYFTPYLIKTTRLVDAQGDYHDVEIGYIGFVPPQIMTWDRPHLAGRVVARDIVECAREWIPKMHAEGAEVIVAIPHSGLSVDPSTAMAENAVYYLSEVPGIDVIAFGHAHAVFPSEGYAGLPGVDIERGTLNGVVSVMPGRWGSHVGIVDLQLQRLDGRWQVVSGRSEARPIFSEPQQQALVDPYEPMVEAVEQAHQNTRDFVGQPIGRASAPLYSFLTLVQDDPTVQIVNDAQRDYVERYIQGDPDLGGLPVLSAAAPFKAGGRRGSAEDFVQVEAGELTYRNAADLYVFPNTLVALKLSGAQIRAWLECSAGLFHRIDPQREDAQALINWEGFRTYNFDVIDGVDYRIDVTQPARFDGDCQLQDAEAERIVQLQYRGEPLDPEQVFLLATNNYRAYGEQFPGANDEHVAFSSPDENRAILVDYIGQLSREHGQVDPSADHNWQLKPVATERDLDIRFETSDTERARDFIREQAFYPIGKVEGETNQYRIDLRAVP